MAVLTIRKYPDPVLRLTSKPIVLIDEKLHKLASDMIDTMEHANGVGLAAPQVGYSIRLIVVDFDVENEGDPKVLINPIIVKRSRDKEITNEGCLSVPNITEKVKRCLSITCEAQDLTGNLIQYEVSGLTARAIQHEIDHLDGMLFIDKIGPSAKLSLRDELADLEYAYQEFKN